MYVVSHIFIGFSSGRHQEVLEIAHDHVQPPEGSKVRQQGGQEDLGAPGCDVVHAAVSGQARVSL